MTDPELIDLITRLLGGGALTISPLSGGSWSRVLRVEGASCAPVVAKVGNAEILKEEQIGLAALAATGAVRIPEVIGCGSMGEQGVLLLEHLQTGASPDWARFAVDLVALHRPGAESRYGFEIDNHLGSTVQRNTWTPDWAEFNRRFRHGPLLETVDIDASDRSLVQKAIDSFSHVLGDPPPVLLHGDLHILINETFMGCMLINDDNPVLRLRHNIGFVDLGPGDTQGEALSRIALSRH